MESRAMLIGNSDGIGLAATKRLLAAGQQSQRRSSAMTEAMCLLSSSGRSSMG
jgi:NAD(P)-dependent dehydrogenase (short-subunit alcohol dehydrogenase family)